MRDLDMLRQTRFQKKEHQKTWTVNKLQFSEGKRQSQTLYPTDEAKKMAQKSESSLFKREKAARLGMRLSYQKRSRAKSLLRTRPPQMLFHLKPSPGARW